MIRLLHICNTTQDTLKCLYVSTGFVTASNKSVGSKIEVKGNTTQD
jgi:hypothetical protein